MKLLYNLLKINYYDEIEILEMVSVNRTLCPKKARNTSELDCPSDYVITDAMVRLRRGN